MIRLALPILIATSVVIVPAASAKVKRVELKPKEAGNAIVIVNLGKARTYYPLSPERTNVVSVKGPGQLRILTRGQFLPNGADEVNYRVVCNVDGKEELVLDAGGVVRSEHARYRDASLGIPGDSEDLTVTIGAGSHTIELKLTGSAANVSARYLFTPRKQKKMKWVSLCPLSPVEPVDLYAGEETAHYYRFSPEKPLKIDIIGPTELRILTRVENSFDMKGRANYRVQIRQGGQVVQSFQLSSRRSETTSYRNNAKLVPGKARSIVFKVPKGRQQYEISPLDKKTLLGQIMFPQKDAKLGL